MSTRSFICIICQEEKLSSEVLFLQCTHTFCLICLEEYITDNLSLNICCPVKVCSESISDRQIRSILSEEQVLRYELLILDNLGPHYTCVLPECSMKLQYEHENIQYECPRCSLYNCIACNAAHKFMTCKEYNNAMEQRKGNLCQAEIARAREMFSKKLIAENRQSIQDANALDILTNDEIFECLLCCLIIRKGDGVKLRNCFHFVCKKCLEQYIKNSDKIPPKCPDGYCKFVIEEREIKNILSEKDYEFYSRKSLNRAKGKLVNHFQCQAPDCDFFCELFDSKTKKLKCPKCKSVNCVRCKAVHKKETCGEYQKKIENSDIGIGQKFIEQQIKEGKCMKCPDCQSLVQKARGCNWIKCNNCNLELCWILQMPRWGPKGRGDISGGCKCMVNEIPCHESCSGCIPHDEGLECNVM